MNRFNDIDLLVNIDMFPVAILLVNLDHTFRAINTAAQKLYGYSNTNDAQARCYGLKHQFEQPCSHSKEWTCPIVQVKKFKKSVQVHHKHRDAYGIVHDLEVLMSPLFDAQGEVSGFLEISHDITPYIHEQEHLKAQSEEYHQSAIHDPLTHLPNRRLLMDRIQQAIHHKTRTHETFALFFLDLDHFKEANDTFGHAAGDALLIEVAKRLKKRIRKGDTVARTGGDEFILIIENGTNSNHFDIIAQKIVDDCSRLFRIQGHEIRIGCSIGISLFPQDGREIDALFHHADLAMYRAKNLGRNQYAFYDK